jgi:hypothetical protein
MDWHPISLRFNKKNYSLCPWTGSLLEENDSSSAPLKASPHKLVAALNLCDNPYQLPLQEIGLPYTGEKSLSKKLAAKWIVSMCKKNFLLARSFPRLSRHNFKSSREAIEYFHSATARNERGHLCLPRSLFAAKYSKSFKNSGVLLIGVFLPSRQMHAWIIENGQQADPYDNIWHIYRPVAALC